jgi:3-oxoacyl-[acyl-carrier-protein] synthase-3
VPPRVLTNADLEKMVETSDEWIMQRTGIRERHIVDPGVATSDLAAMAAREAIKRAGLTPDDIDVIIVGTVTPDMLFPSTAVPGAGEDRREEGVGLRSVGGVFRVYVRADGRQPARGVGRFEKCARDRRRRDVEHHRLHRSRDVRALRRRRGRRRARAIERSGRRHPRLRAQDRRQRRSCALHAGGRQQAAGVAPDCRRSAALREAGRTDSVQVRRPQHRARSASGCCKRNNLTGESLALFVSHQANKRIIMSAAERIGMPEEKVIINIDMYGNTTAATIPLALNTAVESGRLKKGDLILLTSVGAGFTVGSVLVRWGI